MMLDSAALAKQPDLAARSLIARNMGTTTGRKWIKEHQDRRQGIFNKAADETKTAITKTINKMSLVPPGEKRYWAESVKAAWKL